MRVTVKKQDIPKDKIVEISSSPKILMVYDGQKYYAFGGMCPVSYTHLTLPTSDLV